MSDRSYIMSTNMSAKLESVVLLMNQLGLEIRDIVKPGNKLESTEASTKSSALAYSLAGLYLNKKFDSSDLMFPNKAKLYGAAVALYGGGGNCDHYSAITEYLFSTVVKPKLTAVGVSVIGYSRIADLYAKHSFFAFKVFDLETQQEEVIVCDPWAIRDDKSATAANLEENYVFGKKSWQLEGLNSLEGLGNFETIAQSINALYDFAAKVDVELHHNYPIEYSQAVSSTGDAVFSTYSNDVSFLKNSTEEAILQKTNQSLPHIYGFFGVQAQSQNQINQGDDMEHQEQIGEMVQEEQIEEMVQEEKIEEMESEDNMDHENRQTGIPG